MSVIAQIFGQGQRKEQNNTTIPPNLERLVRARSGKRKNIAKYLIVLLISVAFSFLGYFGVQRLHGPTKGKKGEGPEVIAQVHKVPITQLPTTTVPTTTIPSSPTSSTPNPLTPSLADSETSLVSPTNTTTTKATQPPKTQPKVEVATKNELAPIPPKRPSPIKPKAPKRETPSPDKIETQPKEAPELVTKNETERDMYIYQAKAYEEKGDVLSAIEYYKKALAVDPKNFRLRNQLAAICIRIKDGKCAVEHAQLATKLNPEYIPGIVNLAIGLALLGKDLEAEEKLLIALAKNPNNIYTLKNLALIYEKRGELANAKAIYQKLISFGEAEGYLGLGRVLEAMNHYDEAADIYNLICKNPQIEDGIKAYAIQRLNVLTPFIKR